MKSQANKFAATTIVLLAVVGYSGLFHILCGGDAFVTLVVQVAAFFIGVLTLLYVFYGRHEDAQEKLVKFVTVDLRKRFRQEKEEK